MLGGRFRAGFRIDRTGCRNRPCRNYIDISPTLDLGKERMEYGVPGVSSNFILKIGSTKFCE